MLRILVLASYLLVGTYALSCTGTFFGPCVGGLCPNPNNFTCITEENKCCPKAQLSNSTTTTSWPTTKKATPCVDIENPSTGVSDCPKRAYLCNDATYYTLMTQQCPRTCGRCSGSGKAPAPSRMYCTDKVNQWTGRSDCPKRAYLCNNAQYRTLMTEQCPRTCGRCASG